MHHFSRRPWFEATTTTRGRTEAVMPHLTLVDQESLLRWMNRDHEVGLQTCTLSGSVRTLYVRDVLHSLTHSLMRVVIAGRKFVTIMCRRPDHGCPQKIFQGQSLFTFFQHFADSFDFIFFSISRAYLYSFVPLPVKGSGVAKGSTRRHLTTDSKIRDIE